MNHIKSFIGFVFLAGGILNAQNNYFPSTGNIPLNMPASTPANFNLQLNGTADYVVTIPGDRDLGTSDLTVNYGKTSRFGMTNTSSGLLSTDGMLMRMSGLDFAMVNQEKQDVRLSTNLLSFNLSGSTNRAWLGGTPSSTSEFSLLNVITGDNGLYIRTTTAQKFGLYIRTNAITDDAIKVTGGTVTSLVNFNVKASGQTSIYYPVAPNTDKVLTITNATRKLLQLTNDGILKTREVNVDAQSWPDYVFKHSYKLMSLKDVGSFIKINGHLPNVPKAEDVITKGINVADMTKVLMEKVEELTLYLLEQQTTIEKQQAEMEMLKKQLKSTAHENK